MLEVTSTVQDLLSGRIDVWPGGSESVEQLFVEFVREQGLTGLVYQKLNQSNSVCPDRIRTALKQGFMSQAACDALQIQGLRQLLASFASAKIYPLIMKGTALAYTHYSSSVLRPRTDVDLLIRKEDVRKSADLLHNLGYESNSRTNLAGDGLVSHQALFQKTDRSDYTALIDLHWKVSNPVPFADVFTFDELESRSIRIPEISEHSRAIGSMDALLLACIHLVSHHYGEERLIWLYDIFLLFDSFSVSEREQFMSFAAGKRMGSVCSSVIARAGSFFGKDFGVFDIQTGTRETSAAYLNPDLSSWNAFRVDLVQLRGKQKVRFVLEHLFPPPSFMMKKYSASSKLALPFLYFYRILGGLHRWLPRFRH